MSKVRVTIVVVLAVSVFALGGCGNGATSDDGRVTLRLGHFPNLTHAPAIFGLEEGIFTEALGARVDLAVKTFSAGPEVVGAIFSDDLDISYVGPNPAINGFQRSEGEALRIIAGAASGGAALVTKPGITSPRQLRAKKIAAPQLGNTQDVALRAWLADRGLKTDQHGGGDVSIVNQENAQTLDSFRTGQIDGAWVPEPWVSRLVIEGGGKVLLDEGTLWPGAKYATTLVIVRAAFLKEHPDVVRRFLEGHVEAIAKLNEDPDTARRTVNAGIEELTDKALAEEVVRAAWRNLDFTYDPLIETIERSADAAKSVGLLESDDVEGIADLGPLNDVLGAAGEDPVS